MEPGHEDREYVDAEGAAGVCGAPQWSPVMKTGNTGKTAPSGISLSSPQWSPVMKTGNTIMLLVALADDNKPQWSPVMKTGNTRDWNGSEGTWDLASMEPGHEDREYADCDLGSDAVKVPQWSPVMKTGNTRRQCRAQDHLVRASMEPGHEDREYHARHPPHRPLHPGLNGARS